MIKNRIAAAVVAALIPVAAAQAQAQAPAPATKPAPAAPAAAAAAQGKNLYPASQFDLLLKERMGQGQPDSPELRAAVRDERHLAFDTGLEAHRRAGRDVEPASTRRGTVERQRRVRLGEVVVRADLHRPVAGVDDGHRDACAVLVARDDVVGARDLAGDDR